MGVAEGIPGQIHPDLAGRAEYTGPPLDLANRIAEAGEIPCCLFSELQGILNT